MTLIAQKYFKKEDIEAEFIPGIEELIKEQLPSFSSMSEDDTSEYNYYLFCSPRKNSPIGFVRSKIQTLKPNLIDKVLRRKKEIKVSWQGEGKLNNAFFLSPHYKKELLDNLLQIINKPLKKVTIKKQVLISNTDLDFEAKLKSKTEYVNYLFKSTLNFEEYLKSIRTEDAKKLIKKISELKDLNIQSYNNLKDAFSYQKELKEEFKKLKTKFKPQSELIGHYYCLKEKEKLLALAILFKGIKGHYFYSLHSFDKRINNKHLIAICTLNFFEIEDALYLHPIRPTLYDSDLKNLGFVPTPEYEKYIS